MNSYGHKKRFAYTAMVISPSSTEEQNHETDMVLILPSGVAQDRLNTRTRIYGVSAAAFTPPIIERDFGNIEAAKNIERRFSMPLKFGEIIQFNDSDVDHPARLVHCFHREKKLYETSNADDGSCLLKIGGCIDPKNPTEFWTPMEPVHIPLQDASHAEPNVWIYAWIKMEVFMKSSRDPVKFEMTFDSFVGFNLEDQGRVSEAPWQKSCMESRFKNWDYPNSDDDGDYDIYPGLRLEERKDIYVEENKWAEKIQKQLGLYVGERLLLCKELIQYDFIVPLLEPVAGTREDDKVKFIYPTAGEYFHFSAAWSCHHEAFLVTDMTPVKVIRSHTAAQNGNLIIRVIPSHVRGLFTDEGKTLGFIDDPFQHLALFEFHPACHEGVTALVEVRAVRSNENRDVRYRIARVITDDENMYRIDQWVNEANFAVGPLAGVVVSNDTIICAKQPNVYFRLPSHSARKFPVGTGVHVRGTRIPGVNSEIAVTEVVFNPEFSIQNFITNGEITMFQVLLTPMPDQYQLTESEHFGIVDMRNVDHPLKDRKTKRDTIFTEPFYAWIRESPRANGCRRACTMMEVFSVAMIAPHIPITSSSRHRSLHSRHGSTIGSGASARSSANSITTNRFVGPSIRRPQPPASSQSSSSTNARSE